MKLDQIYTPDVAPVLEALGIGYSLTGPMVEPNVMLSMKNVIDRGYANNTFEFICIARLLQMLKNGTFYAQSNPLEVNMSTSKEVMDALRAMKPEDVGYLAGKIWPLLLVKDEDAMNHWADNAKEMGAWLALKTAREAND